MIKNKQQKLRNKKKSSHFSTGQFVSRNDILRQRVEVISLSEYPETIRAERKNLDDGANKLACSRVSTSALLVT